MDPPTRVDPQRPRIVEPDRRRQRADGAVIGEHLERRREAPPDPEVARHLPVVGRRRARAEVRRVERRGEGEVDTYHAPGMTRAAPTHETSPASAGAGIVARL